MKKSGVLFCCSCFLSSFFFRRSKKPRKIFEGFFFFTHPKTGALSSNSLSLSTLFFVSKWSRQLA